MYKRTHCLLDSIALKRSQVLSILETKYACPSKEYLVEAGFKAHIPQKLAGILILPPISAPTPKGEPPEQSNPPSPPELPPGVRS